MKKYLFLLLFVAQAGLIVAQSSGNKEPYMTRSLSADAIKNIEAKTAGGSIAVTGVSPSEARIEVYVSSNNGKELSKEEIRQRLEELYDLDISVANNKLSATARPKENIRDWKKALSIAYKIYVPQNVSSSLVTSGGSIHLTNLSGTQDFTTSGGSLHVSKVSGKIDGTTSGGSIHLSDSHDDIRLVTSGGSIHAENSSGDIDLATSGGSLDLTNLKGNIKATTSGGSVRGNNIEGELAASTSGGSVNLHDLSSSLDASTSGGRINVSFKQLGKYVRLHNSAGDIELTLPKNAGLNLDLSGRISNASFTNFEGSVDEKKVKGKLNGGGVPVTAGTSAGRIRIEWQ